MTVPQQLSHITSSCFPRLEIQPTGEIPDLEGVVSCDLEEVLREALALLGVLFSKCTGVYPTVSYISYKAKMNTGCITQII